MTEEEKKELFDGIAALCAVIKESGVLHADGTADHAGVRPCIERLADTIVENKAECAALKDWMAATDFYTAPASTRFHAAFEGGLALHSLKVLDQALAFARPLLENYFTSVNKDLYTIRAEDIFVACIAHDFCKTDTYKIEYRTTKDISGNWKRTPFYKTRSDNRALGHGNESVLLLLECMPSLIKRRYLLEAVSRHMGFSDLSETESYNYSNFLDNPLVILLQLADETASQWFGW